MHDTQIGETEKDIAIGGGALFNDGVMRGSDLHFEANEAAVRVFTCAYACLRVLLCAHIYSGLLSILSQMQAPID